MAIPYAKISPDQIDLDALSQRIIAENGIVTKEGNTPSNLADDVEKVAGVPSSSIAKAHLGEDATYLWNASFNNDELKEKLKDRNTVLNAVYLGGKRSDDFMTKTEGGSLGNVQQDMINAYSTEIESLKDELYQLRYELERNHYIQKSGFYSGIADYFNSSKYMNIQNEVAKVEVGDLQANADRIIISDAGVFNMFDALDYICLVTPNNFYCIRQIKEKAAGNCFVFNAPLSFVYGGASSQETAAADLSSSVLYLYKSKGIIHNGMYQFATEALDKASSTKIYYNGLSDDRATDTITLNEVDKGYAYSFRVLGEKSNAVQSDSRISEQGYLDYFKILVQPKGAPGKLNCYVFDKVDLDRFKNPVQFENEYLARATVTGDKPIRFFAKASWQPNERIGNNRQYAQFDFCKEGAYPLMSRDEDYDELVEYVVLITADGVDTSNKYEVLCLKGKTSEDLEVNNNWYSFTRKEDSTAEKAISEISNNHDLFFQICTRGVESNMPSPLATGLYTLHYSNQDLKSDDHGQVATLTMRIKREGKYIVSSASSEPVVYLPDNEYNLYVTPDNTLVNNISALCLDDNSFTKDLGEVSETDTDSVKRVPVIIGNNITQVKYSNDNAPASIKAATPILIEKNDMVYRAGYNVAIKAREIKFDRVTGEYSVSPYDRYFMELTNVCKDYETNNDNISDRLIFNATLNPAKKYNDFEVQVYWENHMVSESSRFAGYTEEKMQEVTGGIKDLVLSIDKNF